MCHLKRAGLLLFLLCYCASGAIADSQVVYGVTQRGEKRFDARVTELLRIEINKRCRIAKGPNSSVVEASDVYDLEDSKIVVVLEIPQSAGKGKVEVTLADTRVTADMMDSAADMDQAHLRLLSFLPSGFDRASEKDDNRSHCTPWSN